MNERLRVQEDVANKSDSKGRRAEVRALWAAKGLQAVIFANSEPGLWNGNLLRVADRRANNAGNERRN